MINPQDFRNALGRFATGITIITTTDGQQTHGMTCNAFMSVSLNPPLVAVSVAKKAKMHAQLAENGRYGISILAASQIDYSNHFAGRPMPNFGNPFVTRSNCPLLANAAAHLVCTIVNNHSAGDHTLFIGQVEYLDYQDEVNPLLYHAGNYSFLAVNN